MPSRLLLDQLREIIEVTKGLFEAGSRWRSWAAKEASWSRAADFLAPHQYRLESVRALPAVTRCPWVL